MFGKIGGVVIAAVICSIGFAVAQSPTPAHLPIDPATGKPYADGGSIASTVAGSTQAVVKTKYKVGWNKVHATNCVTNKDSTGVVYVYVYPIEGGNFYSTTPQKQPALLTQCALGNWISFNITSISGTSFSWNDVKSWSNK